jgi:hypothetical protein
MTNHQFCIQTTVQLLSFGASLLLAAVAIWGDVWRARWIGPKLSLTLYNPEGEAISLVDKRPARYYHARVANTRRSAKATNVRIVVTRVLRPAADGSIHDAVLSGPVQLRWQHGDFLPQFPTLGPAQNADLGAIVKGEGFTLHTMFVPNNVNVRISANERAIVEVRALSDQTESAPLVLEINWDGQWSDDTPEMAKHLVVKPSRILSGA